MKMCEGDKALYDLYTSNAAVGRVLTKLYRTPEIFGRIN